MPLKFTPLSWYFTRFIGWELWLWKLCTCGREIDDTLANSVTVFRAKVSLYIGLPAYFTFALTREPVFLKLAISTMIFSGVLDLLDGTIAKLFGKSESGKYLDPAADFINSLVAFMVILGEKQFAPPLVTETGIVAVLGIMIFAIRVLSGVETHPLARAAIATMYLGGLAFFIEMAAAHGVLIEETHPWRFLAMAMGHCLFFVGPYAMAVSAIYYAWMAWPKIHFRLTWMNNVNQLS